MKILIDMNLSPQWVEELGRHGWQARHWSAVGDPTATDAAIMGWARTNGYVVFTLDLDFGSLLALTHAHGPSVIQIRAQDVMPHRFGTLFAGILQRYGAFLERGALVVVDEAKSRVRLLPL